MKDHRPDEQRNGASLQEPTSVLRRICHGQRLSQAVAAAMQLVYTAPIRSAPLERIVMRMSIGRR